MQPEHWKTKPKNRGRRVAGPECTVENSKLYSAAIGNQGRFLNKSFYALLQEDNFRKGKAEAR